MQMNAEAATATLNSARALAEQSRSQATAARMAGNATLAAWCDRQADEWEATARAAAERLTALA